MLEGAGPQQWDPKLKNIEREKAAYMSILGQLVPQAEIFLKSSSSVNIKGGGEDPRKKQMQIKRFDPTNPDSLHLVVSAYSYSKTILV